MTDRSDGWYPDPNDPTQYRHWDGQQWTDATMARDGADVLGSRQTPEASKPRHPGLLIALGAGALVVVVIVAAMTIGRGGTGCAPASVGGVQAAAGDQEQCVTQALMAWPTDRFVQLREQAERIVVDGGANPDFDAWRANERGVIELATQVEAGVLPMFESCGDTEITDLIRRYNNSQRAYAECNIRGADIQQQYGINSPEDQADMAAGCPNEDLGVINAELEEWAVKRGRPIPND